MSIKPLRDMLVAVPCEEVGKVGALWMPDNKLQELRTHRKMLVLYSGPLAQEHCPPGSIIHASESFGEEMMHNGRKVWIGRMRDINGVLQGEQVVDKMAYND